ncbi:MAG: hypothetical protein ABFS46_19435, partial [Myxococcota bacterium]
MPELAETGGVRGWRGGDAGEVLLHLEQGVASVAVARDGCVRIRAIGETRLPPDPGPALGREPWRPAPAEPYRRDEGGVELSFEGPEGCIQVQIDAAPLAIRVLDRAGRCLAGLSGLALGEEGAARIDLAADPRSHYFGFGEKGGPLDKRGQRLLMRNQATGVRGQADPLSLSIPFFVELGRSDVRRGGALATGFLL